MKLFNGKKGESETISMDALIRWIGAAFLALAILFIGCRAWGQFSAHTSSKSFENFIGDIDKMTRRDSTLTISMQPKSAIIGFSRGAQRFECFNCGIGNQNRPSAVFDKPSHEACIGSSCICLCSEFKLEEGSIDGKSTQIGKCLSKLICQPVKYNIVDKTIVHVYPSTGVQEYWKNGILFANGIAGANRLRISNADVTRLKVEIRSDVMGICNDDMIQFNKEQLKFDGCINTEYDEAKRLEQKSQQEALKKYGEFVEKYRKGQEVEESLFILGKAQFASGNYQEAAGYLCRLKKEFPSSIYNKESAEILGKIDKSIAGILLC